MYFIHKGSHIKTKLMDKFEQALSTEELKPNYDLKRHLCKDGLFSKFLKI